MRLIQSTLTGGGQLTTSKMSSTLVAMALLVVLGLVSLGIASTTSEEPHGTIMLGFQKCYGTAGWAISSTMMAENNLSLQTKVECVCRRCYSILLRGLTWLLKV